MDQGKPDFSILINAINTLSGSCLSLDKGHLARFMAIIEAHFKQCFLWDQVLLLTAMNLLECNMKIIISSAVEHEKMGRRFESKITDFEFYDTYTRLIIWYRAIGNIKDMQDSDELFARYIGEGGKSALFEEYKLARKYPETEETLKFAYSIFYDIEHRLLKTVDFKIDRHKGLILLTPLGPDQGHLMSLIETQQDIIDYRDRIYAITSTELEIDNDDDSIIVTSKEKLDLDYDGAGKWISAAFDTELAVIRFNVFHNIDSRFKEIPKQGERTAFCIYYDLEDDDDETKVDENDDNNAVL